MLHPVIGAFGVAKSISHLGPRVLSVPWRKKTGYQTAGAFLSLSLSTEMQCFKSGSRTRPCKSRAACLPRGLVSQILDHSPSCSHIRNCVTGQKKPKPAFISALWVQLPTCAPQGIWACGCLAHEPFQGLVWDTLNTQLCQAGRCRHMKLPSVPRAATVHSFKNIQLLNSITYSGAKIL